VKTSDLQARIDSFPVWHYEFELGESRTPIYRADYVNRHAQRRRAFFDPLVRVAGGTLEGKRVLDLGSNAGYWSLAAIEAGADFVLGIDGRQMHVDQAELVFEAKDIDPARYRFETGNIFTHSFPEKFDVILCLGLMYHISKPMELFEVMTSVSPELMLIDTTVSLIPASVFRIAREDSLENPRNAIDHEVVLIPSRQAVLDLAGQFGFHGAILAHNITDYTGMEDYRTKQRAAFLCSKTLSLDSVERERTDTATLMRAAGTKFVRRQVKRTRRKLGLA
jgi:2-polyprenyl-3-methyl-5-hydroxy-6-metoxy-1,4-benzoquinol methylase